MAKDSISAIQETPPHRSSASAALPHVIFDCSFDGSLLAARAVCANVGGASPWTVSLTGNAIFMYRGATRPTIPWVI